jgi:2-dehydro-3-deoxygluconokinase
LIYGGGEANVAVSLANYGMDVRFVTALPPHDIGDACENFILRQHGVDTSYILRQGDRLGIYFLEMGAVQRGSKVIYDRANSALAEIEPGDVDWAKVFDGADWFHWTGITPAISAGTAEVLQEAVEAAAAISASSVSCDLNYRSKLWKWGKERGRGDGRPRRAHRRTRSATRRTPTRSSASSPRAWTWRRANSTRRRMRASARQLMARFPKLKQVRDHPAQRASRRRTTAGAACCTTARHCYEAKEYDITHIVDRVGGGDSFCGGLDLRPAGRQVGRGCAGVRGGGKLPEAHRLRRLQPRDGGRGREARRRAGHRPRAEVIGGRRTPRPADRAV